MKKFRQLFLLLSLLLFAVGARADNVLTVYEGTTTNNTVPAFIYYFDDFTRSQFVIPAADLADMTGGTISSIKFYTNSDYVPYTTVSTVDVYLMEVKYTSISAFEPKTNGTIVYQGTLDVVTEGDGGSLTINLTTPYAYDGGNLLIGIENTTDIGWKKINFLGQTVNGASVAGYNASSLDVVSASQQNFIPMTSFTYTGGTTPCNKPIGLNVNSITAHSATISWEGTSDSYLVLYQVLGETEWITKTTESESITLTDLEPETTYNYMIIGYCGEKQSQAALGSFTTPVSCVTPTDLAATPEPTSATVTWEGATDGYNLRYREIDLTDMAMVTLTTDDVWGDGSGYQMLLDADANTFGNEIPESGPLTSSGDASEEVYAAFEYKIPTNADGALSTANMICGNSVTIFIPAGTYDWCITNPTPDDRVWIASSNGNVGGRQDDYVFEANKVYEFTVSFGGSNDQVDVTITDVVGSGISDATAWTTEDNVTSPYEITDLTPVSLYEVQVQGDCGEEQSKWVSKYFVTPTVCPVPSDITVDPEATTANVAWEGSNDSYNLRYRKAADTEVLFSEDFESGLGSWTLENCAEDVSSYNYSTGRFSGVSNSGSYAFGFVYTTDIPQYLISPALDGVIDGMTLEFYYRAYNGGYPESFQVGYSSTTNDVSEFTWGDEITTNLTSWQLFSETIPAGTKYFCVKCTSYDQLFLFVDDFVVGKPIDAGEWTTIEDIEETESEITGLESGTDYEVQVQGVCDESPTEWSESVPFTTLFELVLLDNDLAEEVRNNDKLTEAMGKKANVTLSGRTFYKDGKWNSLLLPFDVTEEDLEDENHPLYGATIKQLYSGSVTGTHVDMSFSSVSEIEAGWFYIFKWESGENIVNPVFKNVEIVHNASSLYGGYIDSDGCFYVLGNYNSYEFDPADWEAYPYYLTSEGNLKYSDQIRVMKPFRMFFVFYANDPGALEFNLNFDDGDTQTGIVDLDGNARHNSAAEGIYNLQGMKYNSKPVQKGIYINNGHKVVIK